MGSSSTAAVFFSLVILPIIISVNAADPCYDYKAVYSYGFCNNGVTYSYSGGKYQLRSVDSYYLAPEWDDSNSTYYVRLSNYNNAATYSFINTTVDSNGYIVVTDTFAIINADTGRTLGWRDEGGERFLIETNANPPQYFQLSRDTSSYVPCPLVINYNCLKYNILTAGSSTAGVTEYTESGVTYFKEDTSNLYGFFLIIASSLKMATDQ